ncbi:MAG: hypothetical protein B6A08_01035 [Sorangiineae bacterium NIC37A_2]|jgi:two-component system sensor histidine kinase RegB|nr:MAG: hypothetical protein B6A08_01035 [Sorangiineae bacterium NIC37A_2]
MRGARSLETSPHTGLRRARLALALTALIVSVPTPLSRLWGIGEGPNVLYTLLAVLLWIACIVVPSLIRKGESLRFDAWWPLILDVFFLTGVLGLNSAAENPFTLLYFVPITLATLVSQAQTFRVALAAVLGFGLLFSISAEGVDLSSPRGHFMRHVLGMAIGLAVSGALLTVFFHRIAHELSEQRRRISELSDEQARDRMVTTIGAMAAGAAHELGTPLGTIQLLADDLHLMDRAGLLEAQATIAAEAQRMKRVLSEMDTVELRGELLNVKPWDARELENEARARGARFECPGDVLLRQPERVVRQIVRELLNNAERASLPNEKDLTLSVRGEDEVVELVVLDRGSGFSEPALERALTPFWSTSGRRGLGLFLASTHARTLGGALTLSGREGGGARVVLSLPLVAPFVRSQG